MHPGPEPEPEPEWGPGEDFHDTLSEFFSFNATRATGYSQERD